MGVLGETGYFGETGYSELWMFQRDIELEKRIWMV